MRLDIFLAEHGFTPSRTKAQELIDRGLVFVNGRQMGRASLLVDESAFVEVRGSLPFVSRGGEKLAYACEHFSIDPQGKHALDIGSSTGGFSDFLVQKGAASVTSIDIGTGQFDQELQKHPRINLFEKTDIRNFYPDKRFSLIVMDLSFISQKEIIPHLKRFCAPDAEIIALIKPQFEVGPHNVGKGGIVKNADAVLDCLHTIELQYNQEGFSTPFEIIPSAVLGGDGNQEYFIYAVYG